MSGQSGTALHTLIYSLFKESKHATQPSPEIQRSHCQLQPETKGNKEMIRPKFVVLMQTRGKDPGAESKFSKHRKIYYQKRKPNLHRKQGRVPKQMSPTISPTNFQKSKVTSKHSGLQHHEFPQKKPDKNTGKHQHWHTGGRAGKRGTGAEHQGNQGEPEQKGRKCKDTQKLHRGTFKIKREAQNKNTVMPIKHSKG